MDSLQQRGEETLRGGGAAAEALHFRLNVYPIDIPPLRDRRTDTGVLFFNCSGSASPRSAPAIARLTTRSAPRGFPPVPSRAWLSRRGRAMSASSWA
jgi:hypothetical protein